MIEYCEHCGNKITIKDNVLLCEKCGLSYGELDVDPREITDLMLKRKILLSAGTDDPTEVIMNPLFIDCLKDSVEVVSAMDDKPTGDDLEGVIIFAIILHAGPLGIDEEEINKLALGCRAWIETCRQKRLEEFLMKMRFRK